MYFLSVLIGAVGLGSVVGGIQTVFNASLFAAREFMEIIATIALVTALSKCLGGAGKRSADSGSGKARHENSLSRLVDAGNFHAF